MKVRKTLSILGIAALGMGVAQAGSLVEALEDTQISTTTFIRYTNKTAYAGSAANPAYSGDRTQLRSWVDFKTGEVNGYSVGFGVMLNQGSGMPLASNNNSSHSDLLGTGVSHMGGEGISANLNMFGISEGYLKKSFGEEHSAQVGMMYIKSPFNDGMMDRGLGGSANFKFGDHTITIQGYDSWVGMDQSFMLVLSNGGILSETLGITGGKTPLSGISMSQFAFDNNLFILGASGRASILDYKLYLSHINNMADVMSFLDAGLNFGAFRIGGQVSYTQFTKYRGYLGSKHSIAEQTGNIFGGVFIPGTLSNNSGNNTWLPTQAGIAKNAGLFNVQASYASVDVPFSMKLGYTQSFGESYGVAIDNQGQYNLGGWLWHNLLVFGANGVSMFGSGGVKHASINVAYLNLGYKATSKLSLSLDFAYVTGANNIFSDKNTFAILRTDSIPFKTSFYEVTPQVNYKLHPRLELIGIYSHSFGDLRVGIVQTMLRFKY